MKYLLLISIAVVLLSCTSTPPKNNALISFENLEHNFAQLPYKKEAGYNFEFSNPGETPLVIYEVKTSCGCTVPEWPKTPVKPGDTGEIKIKYDAAFPGFFNKAIKVYYNGKDSPVELSIKGEVQYPDDLEAKTE